MSRKVQVILFTKGKDFKNKIMAVTRKCFDLRRSYPNFGWEFFMSGGDLYFTAYYRDERQTGDFVFPIRSNRICDKYDDIMKQLEDLKLSAVRYESEDK